MGVGELGKATFIAEGVGVEPTDGVESVMV